MLARPGVCMSVYYCWTCSNTLCEEKEEEEEEGLFKADAVNEEEEEEEGLFKADAVDEEDPERDRATQGRRRRRVRHRE